MGTAALQMFVGAFRSPERQEEMKGGGGGGCGEGRKSLNKGKMN